MEMFKNEGALFRGPSRDFPKEVWDPREQKWVPYEDDRPIEPGFGIPVTDEQAKRMMKGPQR